MCNCASGNLEIPGSMLRIARNDGQPGQQYKRRAQMNPSRTQGNAMIGFFFDCSSPWTYLAFHNIQLLAKEFNEEISWRPILSAASSTPSIRPSMPPETIRYQPSSLTRRRTWRDWGFGGLSIKMRPTVFPVNSVKAMRGCIWLGKDVVPFARAVFEIYWGEDQDISQDAVLTEVCKRVGVDPANFLEGVNQQAIKDQLKVNTDEVMTRGGFGSPTIFIDRTDMYFGNDRMPLIREALAAPERERGLMPRAIVCRELGSPECLRLEQVPQMPLQAGRVRVAIRAAGIISPIS